MKISFNSPLVLTFIAISCLELALSKVTNGLIDSYFISPSVFNFLSLSNWTGSILHIFGHANFQHLSGNMIFILLLGPILEEKYGSGSLLLMIIVTAILTSLINAVLFGGGIIGASGIVFLMIVLSSFTSVKSGTIPVTFILTVVLYLGKEFYGSFTSNNVSHFAHILGGAFGGVFGILFSKKN